MIVFLPILTLLTALAGGMIFQFLSLPLPWMLGPLTSVMLVQQIGKISLPWHINFKQLGLIILGVSFGLHFHLSILQQISVYIIPYVMITLLLVGCSVCLGLLIAKITQLDSATTVFGAVPGGLTEMVIASEQLKAEPSQVLIFQTIRLLIVLFLIPYFMAYFFRDTQQPVVQILPSGDNVAFFSPQVIVLVIVGVIGYKLRDILPAGIMIVPLLLTITLMVSPLSLPAIPESVFYGAQLAVGVSLGRTIFFKDIKQAGIYSGFFALLTFLLILISAGLGTLLYFWTDMNLPTALLSAAPGGLIEMVLTASLVGADPAVVTALQLIRIIIIIVFVPVLLKKMLFRG